MCGKEQCLWAAGAGVCGGQGEVVDCPLRWDVSGCLGKRSPQQWDPACPSISMCCSGLAGGKVGCVLLLCGLSTGPGVWHSNCAKFELPHFWVSSWSRNFPQTELESEGKYSHKTSLQRCGQPHVTQRSQIKTFLPSHPSNKGNLSG